MAVTILPNGEVRCDTPEEAVCYTRLLHAAAANGSEPLGAGREREEIVSSESDQVKLASHVTVAPTLLVAPGTRLKRPYGGATPVEAAHAGAVTAENVRKLHELIKGSSQGTFIAVLAASAEGLVDEELWEILGLEKNEALAGITGALKKNSIKAEIGEEFIVRTPAMMNTRMGWRFSLSPRFRQLMDEIGWLARQPIPRVVAPKIKEQKADPNVKVRSGLRQNLRSVEDDDN